MKRELLTFKTEAEWLAMREADITSTECSALFACSPYSTQYRLYHAKTGQLETDLSTLLAEVNHDQGLQLNQAMFLLMTEGEPAPLMQLTKQLMDAALAALAKEAWGYHLAALHDAMSEEQFERYQHRSAA